MDFEIKFSIAKKNSIVCKDVRVMMKDQKIILHQTFVHLMSKKTPLSTKMYMFYL